MVRSSPEQSSADRTIRADVYLKNSTLNSTEHTNLPLQNQIYPSKLSFTEYRCKSLEITVTQLDKSNCCSDSKELKTLLGESQHTSVIYQCNIPVYFYPYTTLLIHVDKTVYDSGAKSEHMYGIRTGRYFILVRDGRK